MMLLQNPIGFTEGIEGLIPVSLAFETLTQLVPGDAAIDGLVNSCEQTPELLRRFPVLSAAPIQGGTCH